MNKEMLQQEYNVSAANFETRWELVMFLLDSEHTISQHTQGRG